jgi:peptide/nickel transport system substrate-binding protein
VRISLTGRVSIEANGTILDEQDFPGRQARLVLAYLLAELGRPVPRDELAEALWGEALPATWEKALAVLVSKLRVLLDKCGIDGRQALRSAFGCYQLVLPEGAWIDVAAASETVGTAEAALAAGDLAEARSSAAAAAALARRPFLPGEHGSWVEEKRRDLRDLLVRSLDCLADACLRSGNAGEAVKHAEELTVLEPFRESSYRMLMGAHSAAGNNAEALRVHERCRQLLAEELGAFPSPETESIYHEILRATAVEADRPAPALQQGRELEPKKRPGVRRGRLVAVGVAAGALAAAAAAITVTRSGGPGFLPRLEANAVGVIAADAARPVAQVALGSRPAAIAAGGGYVWIANEDGTVSRIDPGTRAIRTVDVGQSAAGVVYQGGSLWATKPDEREVAQIDPDTLTVVQTIGVGNGPTGIAAGRGAVWVANTIDGTVSRIALARGARPETVPVGGRPAVIAVAAGSVWVVNQQGADVVRLDARSGAIEAAITVGNGPSAIAAGMSGIWVTNRQDGTVTRLDPATNSMSTTIPVGVSPSSVAVDANGIWVASAGDGTIARIDPGSGHVDRSISVRSSPNALALTGGNLWVTTLPSFSSHRGGVLRVEFSPPACPCSDPAITLNQSLVSLSYDGLLAYRRVGGIGGGELVGNLAVRVPTSSDRGKTYIFQLRRGIHYSNGRPVRASDFRYSLERLLTVNRDALGVYRGIVAAANCAARHCNLSTGIEVDDRASTVTIHLRTPDPDFLDKLTLPFASVVPSGTPFRHVREGAIPATGPYRVARVAPGRAVRLVRNPYFRVWSQDARPDGYADEIRVHFSDDPRERLRAVERGDADWAASLPAGWLTGLLTKYGRRIHTDPAPWIDYMFLNTRVPPFDDLRVRQALNDAVDRKTMVELAGGPLVAHATCQLLPPVIPGYRPICPYTLRPNAGGTWTAADLAKARALVAASRTRGMRVEVFAYENFGRLERVAYARYLAAVLRQLGYRSSVRVISDIQDYVDYTGDSRNRVQIGTLGWVADFAAPSVFLRTLFSCDSFHPKDRSNRNLSEFCDRRIDAKMARAAAVQASDRVRANTLWTEVDRALVDRAAAVPLVDRSAVVFVSKRVGNYQYHPQWGTLLDQLWVR